MEDIQNMAVQTEEVSTPDTPAGEAVETTQPKQERLYTKDEIVNLMKRRVDRSHKAFFNRYKVKDLQEMDSLFDSYNKMKNEYADIQMKNTELMQNNAFLRNNIEPNKYADILAYFKGSDIPFSEEGLLEAIQTHPEWLKQIQVPDPITTIKAMGSEAHVKPKVDEKELAGKLLGVNL